MSVGERQRVEIVRCLLQSPRLLIMDEPTSVLTPQAVSKLFETLRRLATEGVSILYVSHKLDEIRALCDTATVLRGGKLAGTAVPRNETNRSLARMMVGSDLAECRLQPRECGRSASRAARFHASYARTVRHGSEEPVLQVRAGEIVGIAGVSGNGQKELLAAISGETPGCDSGALLIQGQRRGVARRNGAARAWPHVRVRRNGWAGARVPALSLADNALLTGARKEVLSHGIIRHSASRAFART